jgi:hypothetical protein
MRQYKELSLDAWTLNRSTDLIAEAVAQGPLVLPVSFGSDDHRVGAEGHVVDKHPIGDHPKIDPYLLRVAEGSRGSQGL